MLFGQTKSAFIDTDEEKARSTYEYKQRLAKECDAIIERLAQSELSVNEAVCYTLIARHYKRIIVHMANVATSVIVPLSDLDYWDETGD